MCKIVHKIIVAIKNSIQAVNLPASFRLTDKSGAGKRSRLSLHGLRLGRNIIRQVKLWGGGMMLLSLWGCTLAIGTNSDSGGEGGLGGGGSSYAYIPATVYMTELHQRSLAETIVEIYVADVAGSNEYTFLEHLGIRSYQRTVNSNGRAGALSTEPFNFEFSGNCRLYEGGFYFFIFSSQQVASTCPQEDSPPTIYVNSTGRIASFATNCVLFELYQNVSNVRRTIDFVHLGRGCSTSQPQPAYNTENAQWVADSLGAVAIPSAVGISSIVRRLADLTEGVRGFRYEANTFAAANWQTAERSLGLPSDASCVGRNNADDDGDGIYDCLEAAAGQSYFGMPLYDWGARTEQPDIFLEIDYMACAISGNIGAEPTREVLAKVVDGLAAVGYTLHVDVGNLFDPATGTAPRRYDLGGGNNYLSLEQQLVSYYGITLDSNNNLRGAQRYRNLKATNFHLERKQLFYYMVMAETMNPNGPADGEVTLGLAEAPGNDALITLNKIGIFEPRACDINAPGVSDADRNRLLNLQAYTIMHELGHNLSLHHGGGSRTNFKPNYASVMNYAYINHGTPTAANPAPVSNAYYYNNYGRKDNGGVPGCYVDNGNNEGFNPDGTTQAINVFTQDLAKFSLTFSAGTNAVLNESLLNERIFVMGNIRIDYNCDGDTNDSLLYDSNDGTFTGTLTNSETEEIIQNINFDDDISQLSDFDDEANIELFHAPRLSHVFALGANSGDEGVFGVPQVVTSDKQPVVESNEEPVFNVASKDHHRHAPHSEALSHGHGSTWGQIKAWISRYFSHKK